MCQVEKHRREERSNPGKWLMELVYVLAVDDNNEQRGEEGR